MKQKSHTRHAIPACTWYEKIKINVFCTLFNFTWVYVVDPNGVVQHNYLINNSYGNRKEFIQEWKYFVRKTDDLQFYAENNSGGRIDEISDAGFDKLLTKAAKKELKERFGLKSFSLERLRAALPQMEMKNKVDKLFRSFEDDFINDGEIMTLSGTV